MTVPFDPRQLLQRPFAPLVHDYEQRDVQLYALGLGFGMNPSDTAQLPFVYEGTLGGSIPVVPTFANVLAYPGFWARDLDTGIDWRRLVHAEQEIVFHRLLPPSGRVTGHNRISALWDRGEGRGALMEQTREVLDTAGDRLATVKQLTLLRGNGGFGAGGSEGHPPVAHALPQREPDAIVELRSSPQTALIYRLSGDLNPLHADPGIAQAAGFERPILHGMATMGIAAHALLRSVLEYRCEAMASMRVRFTAPAYPGESFRTEIWRDDGVISFRTVAVGREVTVLDNGCVSLKS